jgi:hypothetical protein
VADATFGRHNVAARLRRVWMYNLSFKEVSHARDSAFGHFGHVGVRRGRGIFVSAIGGLRALKHRV